MKLAQCLLVAVLLIAGSTWLPISSARPVLAADELTITITGLYPWHPVYDRYRRSFSVLAHVEHEGVPQAGATITFTIYNPAGVVEEGDSITRLTDANGEMTCSHYFNNQAKRGIYTLVVEVEKDGLTGTAQELIEYQR